MCYRIFRKFTKRNQREIFANYTYDKINYYFNNLIYATVLVVDPEFGERMSKKEYEGLQVE